MNAARTEPRPNQTNAQRVFRANPAFPARPRRLEYCYEPLSRRWREFARRPYTTWRFRNESPAADAADMSIDNGAWRWLRPWAQTLAGKINSSRRTGSKIGRYAKQAYAETDIIAAANSSVLKARSGLSPAGPQVKRLIKIRPRDRGAIWPAPYNDRIGRVCSWSRVSFDPLAGKVATLHHRTMKTA